MRALEITVGVIYIAILCISCPAYARIVYVFISNPRYRKLECYQLMIQIGVVQLLTALSPFDFGLKLIIGTEPLPVVSDIVMKLMTICIKTETLQSLALALNRLKIMCNLKYPKFIHSIILATIYVYALASFGFVMSPLADIYVPPGEFMLSYNLSLPYTIPFIRVTSITTLVALGTTFFIYVLLIGYLIWLKLENGRIIHFHQEKKILLYAGVRFIAGSSLILLFHFVSLPRNALIGISITTSYIVNNLVLPVLLYMTLYKSLRKEVVTVEIASRSSKTTQVLTQVQSLQ
ncbi:hypothetical protein QR680_010053 [Steinernema hermaphroditum]|uniref:Uncharacterized protein n=1 Tax=Steinernema hermaphroditum TaxID=289476 RepID=A0AA39MB24_9BILA|nr:hypothetical protein QR680_010053 [Steinernema hermaphroditum]